ncbi:MAG: hypothetical protein HWN65_17300 [Candidatus Helarchaeota archaeon]|nr:hypothetical protein [Candidatus Helarchaeota archaeon]
MDRKFNTLQQILNHLTEDSGFFGSIISSEEGLVVMNSTLMDPNIEIESLAAKAAAIFNEDGVVTEHPEDITITYPNKKIFIQKISLIEGNGANAFLIVLMPPNMRYFKRKVFKLRKFAAALDKV